MKSDVDSIVDDLLSRWHDWKSGYRFTRGYSSTDGTCKEAKSAWSSYDRDNGVADEWVENSIMAAVDAAIERIEEPYHLCILFDARNLASEYAVWSSPRLPQGEELEILKIESRTRLLRELRKDGVVG
jgi:hypothetical protein